MARINLLEQEIVQRASEQPENTAAAASEYEGVDTLLGIRNDAVSDLAELSAIDEIGGLLDVLLDDLLGSLL